MKKTFCALLLLSTASLLAENTFEKLYIKASTPSDSTRIILADNFESGIRAEVQKLLHCEDPQGKAGLSLTSSTKASGSNALKIQNSTTVKHSFMPALSQWFKGSETIKSGTIAVNFDFKIPKAKGVAISIECRDYSVKPHLSNFSAVLTPIGFRLGEISKAYPTEQWLHCELTIPVQHSGKSVTMSITEANGTVHKTELAADSIKAVSWIGLMMAQKNKSYVYLDNLVISHNSDKSSI
ncbi:hypothetical protein LNTAR_22884 [Lentisphaera araneosa HTCC2155]|uniref:Uncharacterized protein n=1 Tax=Lentisphaera araneosa HTCC2155 TaxID=313628 RepID=A6DGG8_9BACT|nr:hypothetical protein [Lentisphaera araneosa]EDM29285.1 hypothetical protein LNTAR_22884 [Lentisphaera araneosa HTCC2155]